MAVEKRFFLEFELIFLEVYIICSECYTPSYSAPTKSWYNYANEGTILLLVCTMRSSPPPRLRRILKLSISKEEASNTIT